MTTKPGARDVVLHADAAKDLAHLDASNQKSDVTHRTKVRALRPILLDDCLHGEVIPRKKIPKDLRARYDLDNLYIEDIAGWKRLLYTVQKDAGDRYVIILRIINHATYDKWFPNKGK